MRLRIRIGPWEKQTEHRRSPAMAISLVGHVAAFLTLMHAPEIKLPPPSPSEYQQAIAGKEQRLIWYKFNKTLPNVTPQRAKAEKRPVRAELRAKQQIVASPKRAPRRTQIVWTEAPILPEFAPLESPNVLAMRLPEIAPPPKKPAREFVAPEVVKPALAKVEILDAPQIPLQTLSAVVLPGPTKIVKAFVPPPKKIPVKLKEVAPAPETPTLASVVKSEPLKLEYSFRLPPRPFTAPPSKPTTAAAKKVSIETPPLLNADALIPRELNLAVVGLKPIDKPAPLPAASNPAQFSAGPVIRPAGADAAGDSKGVNVPDLFVSGAREAKPDLIAQAFAAPTSAANLREAMRLATGTPAATVRAAPRPLQSGAIQVSGAPDPRFNGREVFMMAIQMPNLTSSSGSWLMWYADRTQREAGLAPIAPPVAYRKVDPKYVAAAVADKVEGKVQLGCVIGKDGHVFGIELVRGLDERLDQSAKEALSKWEFTPASRHGEPVEVDVLVEIPFRLAPRAPVSF
jgi:TonB family protein